MILTIQFAGGCETLFGGKSRIVLEENEILRIKTTCRFPPSSPPTTDFEKDKKKGLETNIGGTNASSSKKEVVIGQVLTWLVDHYLTQRKDLFVLPHEKPLEIPGYYFPYTIRPGLLVLLDDVDWEILGGLLAEVSQKTKVILFLSTLHGG